ncbi:energy transducer TonB [Stenotrophomonas koreensis]|uniref:Protein TonB n=1 Tax=Stenotrophomonas koreensis TaxID=266128 RepID=A0A0R0BE95_9GAMM|nr:energy transducer TonB [Stenotrophomonas koreensis]KRG55574.1 energy transducer TonB [Stenotrophomonas koreensis]
MSHLTITGSARPLLTLLLLGGLVACSGGDTAAPAAATDSATSSSAAPASVAADLNLDELREKASAALRENRMYAPAGDNAIEYYLAVKEKAPDDPYVASALTDLLPYTLTAAELNITREDFEEANRLVSLIERVNAQAPALPRLKQAVADGQALVARRSDSENERAKREAEQRSAQQVEQQRLAQQQAAEAAAARQLASLQQAAREASAREQAEQTEQQTAAARREAEQKAAAEAARLAAARQSAATTAAASTPTLRAVSTPAPRYPADALRAGTAGEVLMEITVGTDGSVTNARVLRSQPARIFDREAMNAVRRWKYEPIAAPTTVRRTLAFSPQG